ncbi:hypothetical protein [Dactylosporangium darangshiense]|uniref:Uncharacterized protein n=1 Tax=Dactylosporangium darangshiense TaxID=579108 RepID=A0ABP8DMV8_9ACTN
MTAPLTPLTTSDQQPSRHSRPAHPPSTMDTRAVITITEQRGTTRAFPATWASPEYLIPLVAHFLAWVDEGQHRLAVQTWLAYADTFPGTLPREDVTDAEAADDTFGDLDYRYQLYLHEDSGAMLLRAYSLRELRRLPRPRLVFELTRANLFTEAAVLCEVLADRAQQWADSHGGTPPPGNDPAVWRRHEARFRRIHASTPVTALGSNATAQFVPASFDAPYPAIQVAGTWVFAYVDRNGTLRIAAHLEQTERWLQRPDGTVPMRVSIQDTVVFES